MKYLKELIFMKQSNVQKLFGIIHYLQVKKKKGETVRYWDYNLEKMGYKKEIFI